MVGKTERTMGPNGEGAYFQESDHVRIKLTQEIGRVPASLYSSLILQEGCTKVPEQVLNSKVLSLVDLYRVSKVARQLPCFPARSRDPHLVASDRDF